jgi:hypothetical protein
MEQDHVEKRVNRFIDDHYASGGVYYSGVVPVISGRRFSRAPLITGENP